ncbi:hypothetical protein ACJMK2_005463 [Sinanodonta woodiana]|uniref:Securin n=1 Tax=Sinanodonta woodiana TaxID=1069815 RepID=A0ABD3VQ49_SINWO
MQAFSQVKLSSKMTSLSVFQPYIDKENTNSLVAHPKARNQSTGLGGKVYHNAKQKSLVTPRKALGDVNRDLQADVSQSEKGKGLQLQSLKSQQPQPSKNLQFRQPLNTASSSAKKTESIKKSKSTSASTASKILLKPVLKKAPETEEIEKLYIYKDNLDDDDYEDIMPKKDRISTFLKKFQAWGPCLFGPAPDSETEEETEDEFDKKTMDEIISKMPPPTLEPFSPTRSEISFEELLDNYEDIPIPPLDDSINLIPNLGSLEINYT